MTRCLAPRAVATLLGVVLCAAASHAEEAVMLASTAPGYAPGMVVSETERLNVPEGASATLLFRNGEMLRLRGPFNGPLGPAEARAAGAGSVSSLAESLRLHGVDAAVVGGTRSLFVPPGRRNPDAELVVDTQRSATYCLGPGPTTVWIARPSEAAEKVLIRRRGLVREVAWPPNAARAEWPVDLSIVDGEHYEVVDESGAVRTTMSFHVVEHPAPSPAARIADAVLAGCQEQVATALRELGRTMTSRELWVASDRGHRPSYGADEPMRLVAQANADGWLYCSYRRGDASVIPIFPSGALDGARVRSHEMLTIPGQRRAGEVSAGPPGEGRVSCWFADRDIGPELPHALFADAARPLPHMLAERLDEIFNEVGGAHVVKATVLVRIERADASR